MLNAGTKLGPYEIVAPLGAGGMGEVYRARDTKLGRDVALKVLPAAFAADPERMARFRREAQVLASLNHPHIGAIYGFEDSGSVHALVMELIEGPTLADRIARGPIPSDEALPCAREIAEALEAAHERGIVHRDLKPANIKITPDGNVKVLDFGLAKAIEADPSSTDIQNSPTISRMATQAGIILGTAAYMSPEQARGKSVDRRTDIWAFGCVLFEMLTGKRAFEGETVSDTLAAVIRAEPEWSLLPSNTPQRIRNLLLRCLKKDPKQRLQSIGEVRITIDDEISGVAQDSSAFPPSNAQIPARGWQRAMPWAALAAALAIALAASLFFLWRNTRSEPQAVLKSAITLPENQQLPGSNPEVALSPDGTVLAFVSHGSDGKTHLWLRRMNSTSAQPLEGTEGADAPFWSPDSRYIGFFANGRLQKIPGIGGTAVALCSAPDIRGASWGSKGTIVYSPGRYTGLYKVSEDGGTPVAITKIEGRARTDRMPYFLPDGKHLLFYSKSLESRDKDGIYSLGVASGKMALVLREDSAAIYVRPGLLIFVRQGNLMAQPFDAGALKLSGEAVPIANGVQFSALRYSGNYSFSDTGLMVYQPGVPGNIYQLTWFDSEGHKISTVGKPGALRDVALSPKEDKAAVVINEGGQQNIWIYDLARQVASRFTFGNGPDFLPVWSPDGNSIVYRSDSESLGNLYEKSLTGDAVAKLLLKGTAAPGPLTWSPDGKYLVYAAPGKISNADLWLMPMQGDEKPSPLVVSSGDETLASFSPDGHWLLYRSNESGQPQIYVTRFPEGNSKWQITSGTGFGGSWTDQGKRIVYSTQERKLFQVDVTVKNGSLEIGAERPYFGGQLIPPGRYTVVTKDAKRVLDLVPLDEQKQDSLMLVTNWQAELKPQ